MAFELASNHYGSIDQYLDETEAGASHKHRFVFQAHYVQWACACGEVKLSKAAIRPEMNVPGPYAGLDAETHARMLSQGSIESR